MAKIIAFAGGYDATQKVWIHPDAVQSLFQVEPGVTSIIMRSGQGSLNVGGDADFVASKLNEASE